MEQAVTGASLWQVAAAAVVFLAGYGLAVMERWNRALVALCGAVLLIVAELVGFREAFTTHIEWQTILLLAAMMAIAGIAGQSGLFQYAAVKAAQSAKGNGNRLLLYLALLTAGSSAILDNVTAVLLVVPFTLALSKLLKLPPVPFLIVEMIAANIGGTATMIGVPTNMMIGTAAGLDFNSFLIRLVPVSAVILSVTLFYLHKRYGKRLIMADSGKKELMKLHAGGYITNKPLLKKSLYVLSFTLLGFVLHDVIHAETAAVAAAGAVLLAVAGRKDYDKKQAFLSIDWTLLCFFAGLFLLVGGLVEAGITGRLAEGVLTITGGDIGMAAMLVLWVAGIVSAAIDNIPFAAAMIPVIKDMGRQLGTDGSALEPVWWSLALGCGLGANGSLAGASANLIAAGLAGRSGDAISYTEFFKVGAPVTFISLLISTVYVYIVLL